MLFVVLIATLYNIETSGKLVPDQSNNVFTSLATCINNIYDLHENFYKLTLLIYDSETEENIPDNIFKNDMIKIAIENKIPFIKTNNLNERYLIKDIDESTVIVVVYLKDCNEMTKAELRSFDIKFKYVIIVDTFLRDKCYDAVTTKLSELYNYEVTLIIADRIPGKYNFLTAVPEIDEVTCNTTEIVEIKHINNCTNGTLDEKRLTRIFPVKAPSNFKLCNFNVGMSIFYPYSMTNNTDTLKDFDDGVNFYGVDIDIMKIMAKRFNSTLKLFYITKNDYDPKLRKIVVQYLLNETLDAYAGGAYRLYGDEVSYSGIYSRQTVIWVYTVERNRRTWQSLLFKMNGLYIFLIIYQCYVILWNLISKFDHQTISILDSFVYGWGALFGGAGLQDARSLKQKFLNIVYLIACLHLSAYVSTQIYYYLTIDRPPNSYTSVDELTSSGKIPYLIPNEKYFIDDKKYIAFANTSRQCDTFLNCEELMLINNGSTIIIDAQLAPLQSSSAVHDEARVLQVPEYILVVYHEMILRKNSPLVKKFQEYTQRLFESGICQMLYVRSIGITVVDRAKIANQNILSNSYSCTVGCEITLSQLAGVFYIWMAGCFCSCIVFILEILMKIPLLTH
ncbi:uncharacterized protein LOC125070101 [Vanessa atalanta]|uniref:uncharacterized protein LOC125070101 n=1 Tax=Vanessa atalanta TaxID=42275 RepID=UPI001FCD95A9|nr:uncharacterized protein LOC125070101 [Vanessa atalanta]